MVRYVARPAVDGPQTFALPRSYGIATRTVAAEDWPVWYVCEEGTAKNILPELVDRLDGFTRAPGAVFGPRDVCEAVAAAANAALVG